MTTLKKRNSAFELLKIFAMLMIITSHYSTHGGVNAYELPFGINSIVLNLAVLGNLGVVIFMMISGYFLFNSTKVKIEKLVKIILEAFFYVNVLYFVSVAVGEIEFSAKEYYKSVLFLFFGKSWFVVNYILIYIFHPYINKLLKSLTEKELTTFIIILFVFWSVIPTITLGTFEMNNLISMFTIYSFGASINILKDLKPKYFTKKAGGLLVIINALVIFASVILINFIGSKVDAINPFSTHFLGRFSIFVILLGGGFVILAMNAKPFYSPVINFISSFALGVYLIHDNDYFRNYLWRELIRVPDYATTNLLIPHLLGSVLVVFLSCLIIDIVRYYLLETPLFLVVNKIKNRNKKSKENNNLVI